MIMSVDTIYLVSACLMGQSCRYDGKSCSRSKVIDFLAEKSFVAVCPEEAGGLLTPRAPAEIQQGSGAEVLSGSARVLTQTGVDVTRAYVAGAQYTVRKAKSIDATVAILKAKSPSCGNKEIYDGSFNDTLVRGEGVTSAGLRLAGVRVLNETEV